MQKRIQVTALALACVLFALCGCTSYKGGKVVDGTNLEIGISIPGTDWSWTINALSYTGGLKVCGDEKTRITVTNKVIETNTYFGVIKTQRQTEMHAVIDPRYYVAENTNKLVYAVAPRKAQ